MKDQRAPHLINHNSVHLLHVIFSYLIMATMIQTNTNTNNHHHHHHQTDYIVCFSKTICTAVYRTRIKSTNTWDAPLVKCTNTLSTEVFTKLIYIFQHIWVDKTPSGLLPVTEQNFTSSLALFSFPKSVDRNPTNCQFLNISKGAQYQHH